MRSATHPFDARPPQRSRWRARVGVLAASLLTPFLPAAPATAATATAVSSATHPGVIHWVNTTSDTTDGTCDATHCSLREAIASANAVAGTDSIVFSIGGSGHQVITLASALPVISGAVLVDGTTQPGFTGTPIIEITGASSIDAGLWLAGSTGSTIRGLVINGVATGILAQGGGQHRIEGNYLGTDVTGTTVVAGFNFGAITLQNSAGNTVGGSDPAVGNLISGPGGGVHIAYAASTGNVVQGNRMGTTADGTAKISVPAGVGAPMTRVWISNSAHGNTITDNLLVAHVGNSIEIADAVGNTITGNLIGTDITSTEPLPSSGDGVKIFGANNVLGGPAPGDRNVIAQRVALHSGATGNVVQGNAIGTDASGTVDLNEQNTYGIDINGSSGNTVAQNHIAFNGGAGVLLVSGTGNTFTENRIHDNGGLGIDLYPIGTPNNNQAAPSLTGALTSTSGTHVTGSLTSTAGRTFRVEAFDNAACDPSGAGEGETFLGADDVTTDATGAATIDFVATGVAVGTVTATATDLTTGDTSEFSTCTASAAAPATAYDNRILFSSEVGGNRDIFTIAPDGTDRQRVTTDPGNESYATWSPDGTKIAYVQGSTSLRIVNADGSGTPVEVTTGSSLNHPDWSPDGTKLVFAEFNGSAASGGTAYDISMVGVDGTGRTNLTAAMVGSDSVPTSEGEPVISPDGATLAFLSSVDGSNQVFLLDLGTAGASPQQLTTTTGAKPRLEWRPDGASVTYSGGLLTETRIADGVTSTYPFNLGASGYSWASDGDHLVWAGSISGMSVRQLPSTQTEIVSGESIFYPEWIGGPTATPTNSAPTAADDGFSTDEDVALTVAAPGVLGNDSDGDGDQVTASLVVGPANGTLTLNADGSFTYTPTSGFTGTDSFTYVADDGTDQSSPATVTIDVLSAPAPACVESDTDIDTDGDGVPDHCDVDDDDDGLIDIIEIWLGCDPKQKDTDGDGLDDGTELWLGTDPTLADSDPSDGHGSDRAWLEAEIGSTIADPNGDPDGDGVPTAGELFHGTDPAVADTDGADGHPSDFEALTAAGTGTGDDDGDGLPNGAEALWGTDPNSADTDGNGQSDVIFIIHSCPAYPSCYPEDEDLQDQVDELLGVPTTGVGDQDGDGLSDPTEALLGTDPADDDTDGDGSSDLAELVAGTPPTASLGECATANSWDPVPLGTAITLCSQLGGPGPFVGGVDWDAGSGTPDSTTTTAGAFTASHTYTEPGVYRVTTYVEDANGARHEVEHLVVVYDPDGGFVTGGGWIHSPAGAYTADPTLAGKATFGFVSKYKKGASVPTGTTEFQFHAGGLDFRSSSYQWLVISGARAQYKGVGTVNGAGEYGFLLTATDSAITGGGTVDGFRIKIWAIDDGEVVYDNQLGATDDSGAVTALGGGSIVIHQAKKR